MASAINDDGDSIDPTLTHNEASFFSACPRSVLSIYLSTVLLVSAELACIPVFVPYFNELGWTSEGDVFFYSLLMFLTPLCQCCLSPLFGYWQGRRSTTEVFLVEIISSSYGYLTMALINLNRWVFLAGFMLTRISLSMGSCRTTYIIRTVPPSMRTQALALQPVAALSGAFIGPSLALLCSFVGQGAVVNGIAFNQSTVTFFLSTVLSTCRLPLLLCNFREQRFSDVDNDDQGLDQDRNQGQDGDGSNKEEMESEGAVVVSGRRVWMWLMFSAVCLFAFQISNGVYNLCYIPILVNHWGFGQLSVAAFLLCIVFCSIFPPTFMAFLNRRFRIGDRWFLLCGLVGYPVAALLFAVPWQRLFPLVVAGVIGVPLSQLIGPACNSLFSAKVGSHRSSGFKMGILSAVSALGNTVGSLVGNIALQEYRTFDFLAWTAPCWSATILVILVFPHLKMRKSQSPPSSSFDQASRDLLSSHPNDA